MPAAAPVEAVQDDGEPPAKLDGGALAKVRSVTVIVPDTPEGSAPMADVNRGDAGEAVAFAILSGCKRPQLVKKIVGELMKGGV